MFLAATVWTTTGCERTPLYQEKRFIFGTLVEIKIYGESRQQAQQAATDVFADLQRLHVALHPWQQGALSRTNALLTTGEWFSVAPTVLPVVEQAKRLYQQSDGLFDPAIGQLIGLWGFHGDTPSTAPPDDAAIETLLKNKASMKDIELNGIFMRGHNPKVQLDLSGIAKGHAVQVGLSRLKAMGIHNALIDAGGDLGVIGRHGQRPWKIAIRHPRQKGVLATLDLKPNEYIFTSGDYERFFKHAGKRYHHALNPRTGRPAQGLQSVTIIHNDGPTADAAATALFVAGPKYWYAIAKKMGLRYVMLVKEDGQVLMSPAMAKRVQITVKPSPTIETSQAL
ncbi:MAG: FAD:protein FMN transferase [Gammaproteobacteria bacterium]|nr:FAD:protein FMN transferase [Gammaproteobacteria bacterium]